MKKKLAKKFQHKTHKALRTGLAHKPQCTNSAHKLRAQAPHKPCAQTLCTNSKRTQKISKHKQSIYSDPAIVIAIPQGRFKFESPPDLQIHANAETHAF